jgi:hypothetical protein
MERVRSRTEGATRVVADERERESIKDLEELSSPCV